MFESTARFVVAPCGRRSGKTEIAKRRGVLDAIRQTEHPFFNVVFAAPTYQQAKRIYWGDLKRMVPSILRARAPIETELVIPLVNGSQIMVVGMDKPERIEGSKVHRIFLDEYGNMRANAWEEHIRPTLSDTEGTAWFYGVPEGRNHYYDLFNDALADDSGDWATFHWTSSTVLPPKEIAAARRDMDPRTFQQEYEASFLNFAGRIYYAYNGDDHIVDCKYDPTLDLRLCLDFNVDPGVAVIGQEAPGTSRVVDEIHIPNDSRTELVMRKFLADYSAHPGLVYIYGDASGGSRKTSQTDGTDWAIVKRMLKAAFGPRLRWRVPKANPSEKARVNAVNTRLRTADGTIQMQVAKHCRNMQKDLDGVVAVEGGSGEIDKRDGRLTHLSDALGYWMIVEHPLDKKYARIRSLY